MSQITLVLNSKRKRIRNKSNAGSRFANVYTRRIDEKGEPIMVIKETKNIYEEIQSYKDDNNIYKILKQFNNDISKVDFNKGVYLDLTKLPDNYNDMYNTTQALREDYDLLPADFKQKINNNFNLYAGLALSGKLQNVVDNYKNNNIDKIKPILNQVNVSTVKDESVKDNIKSEVKE